MFPTSPLSFASRLSKPVLLLLYALSLWIHRPGVGSLFTFALCSGNERRLNSSASSASPLLITQSRGFFAVSGSICIIPRVAPCQRGPPDQIRGADDCFHPTFSRLAFPRSLAFYPQVFAAGAAVGPAGRICIYPMPHIEGITLDGEHNLSWFLFQEL